MRKRTVPRNYRGKISIKAQDGSMRAIDIKKYMTSLRESEERNVYDVVVNYGMSSYWVGTYKYDAQAKYVLDALNICIMDEETDVFSMPSQKEIEKYVPYGKPVKEDPKTISELLKTIFS